jgi:redox-sensitive bicupin YhaK (pirin superfamily)
VESTKAELMKSQKTRGQVVFIRNIQLFFTPPAASKLDSPAVQKRKQLNRERCERRVVSVSVLRGACCFKNILGTFTPKSDSPSCKRRLFPKP